ncbi:hypothetical protein [Polaribacter pacificus]|nr:hypothetical protein [Polaribacter pacificus]
MKKTILILKLIQLLFVLPFSILKGAKKKSYHQIKKTMIAANLL